MANAYSATKAARWLPLAAGALVLAAQPAMAQQRTCEVAEAAGEATLTHDGNRIAAQVGADLATSDVLHTGSSGRIDVACSDGTRVTLGPDTAINLGSLVGEQDDNASIGMSLHRGIARFLAPVRTWGTFNVFGPVAVASVRSTEWIMETPKLGTNVFVLDGVVAVQSKRGGNVQLSPTFGIDVAPDGSMGEAKKWGAKRVADVLTRLGLQ
ncbi:MAG TPA: FecR family protein [Dongiaceae bacterium]|nr:FecR family protein [Dongiaceae bacterium]